MCTLVLCMVIFLYGCTRKTETDGLEAYLETEDIETEVLDGKAVDAGKTEPTEVLQADEKKEEEIQPQLCYVHICGAVKNPGVYCMKQGDRIFEVIEIAGGFTEDACEDYINQAESILDGLKLWIPTAKEAMELGWKHPRTESGGILQSNALGNGPDTASDASNENAGLVNINTATVAQLCSLSGIGEAKAQAIVAYRNEHGSFRQKEDIMKVAGIKQSGYEKIKDRIWVGQE